MKASGRIFSALAVITALTLTENVGVSAANSSYTAFPTAAADTITAAHASDSVFNRSLEEVVVYGERNRNKEVIPSQTLSGEQLKGLNSHSVADAIRYFAGVQLKDYGGVGGVKTLDIRSMGTNHMGIFYDGIQLGNAQNGQIDLGRYSLDNIESITLYNGQKKVLLLIWHNGSKKERKQNEGT